MKTITTIFLTVLSISLIANADPSQPAPAQQAPAPQAQPPAILLIPFQQLGDTTAHAWVGQALQESMISQTARDPNLETKAMPASQTTSDAVDALRAARDAGASIVIFGSFQTVGDNLRVLGNATDVASGRIIGMIQADGNIRDLFAMEDNVNAQLAKLLPQFAATGPLPMVTNSPYAQQPQYNVAPPPDVTQYYSTYTPAPDYAAPDYAYPSYDYGYPYDSYFVAPYISFGGGRFFDHSNFDRFGGDHRFFQSRSFHSGVAPSHSFVRSSPGFGGGGGFRGGASGGRR